MSRFVRLLNGALTVVVLAAAVAAVLALTGQDALSHLAPVYGAVGLAGGMWAVVAGRGPIVAASVLAIVGAVFLVRPELNRDTGPVAAANAPGQIKVIQINARRTNTDIRRVVSWLIAQNPDVVTVSEARHDLRDLLRRQAGWKVAGAQGDLMIFTRERYVVMNRPRLPNQVDMTFVNATYATTSGPVEVMTTHMAWPVNPVVPAQLRHLEALTARLPRERMILTGDFNAAPWSRELRRLDASLGLTRRDRALATWPAQVLGVRWPLPFVPIDHVYAGPGWATVKVERGPWLGSDHYPVIVTLAPVTAEAAEAAAPR